MSHKLDLALVHINYSRHILSKWLSVSFSDLVLLSGQDIDIGKNYTITYRYEDKETCSSTHTLSENMNGDIQLSHGMQIFVNETDRTLGNNK